VLGEGGRALQRLSEGIDALLAAAPLVPTEEKLLLAFLMELRKQLNRGELAFSVAAGRYAACLDRGGHPAPLVLRRRGRGVTAVNR
jgi:hypothetical protein